jgi:hypothetical protein
MLEIYRENASSIQSCVGNFFCFVYGQSKRRFTKNMFASGKGCQHGLSMVARVVTYIDTMDGRLRE